MAKLQTQSHKQFTPGHRGVARHTNFNFKACDGQLLPGHVWTFTHAAHCSWMPKRLPTLGTVLQPIRSVQLSMVGKPASQKVNRVPKKKKLLTRY